jgi:ABC-2 type transport system permease protein
MKFLGITLIGIVVFIIIGEIFYFKGVLGISETSSSKKRLSKEDIKKRIAQNSAIKAYTKKELKLLYRTPIYFLNCILMNFLWPLFLILPIILQPEAVKEFDKLRAMAVSANGVSMLLAGTFIFGIFITSSNCITATSISREGENLFISKYIPMSYKEQLLGKALSGIVMGIVGNFMIILCMSIILKLNLLLIMLMSIVCFIGIIFSSFIGLIIDLYRPKLHWDNEQKAVKQNLNVIFNMAIATTIGAAIFALIYAVNLNLWGTFAAITVIYGAANVILYKFIITRGVNIYKSIEI